MISSEPDEMTRSEQVNKQLILQSYKYLALKIHYLVKFTWVKMITTEYTWWQRIYSNILVYEGRMSISESGPFWPLVYFYLLKHWKCKWQFYRASFSRLIRWLNHLETITKLFLKIGTLDSSQCFNILQVIMTRLLLYRSSRQCTIFPDEGWTDNKIIQMVYKYLALKTNLVKFTW